MSLFEKFVQNNAWKYKTDKELNAAYVRHLKCIHGVLITETDFIQEAGEHYNLDTLKAVYRKLTKLVEQRRILDFDLYNFACFKWCLTDEKAIIAYQTEHDNWEVNRCDTEVTEEKAKFEINREWGFEAKRIRIVGTPYYATDLNQFIRFNIEQMPWLWTQGVIHQIYYKNAYNNGSIDV